MMLSENRCDCPSTVAKSKVSSPEIPNEKQKSVVIDSVGPQETFFLYGTLKKEDTPEEYKFGDFWYWVYFEEPHLLVNNASGVPQYIDRIEVYAPETESAYNIDEFDGKKVEVHGYIISDYTGSVSFQIDAIREY